MGGWWKGTASLYLREVVAGVGEGAGEEAGGGEGERGGKEKRDTKFYDFWEEVFERR